MEGVSGAPGRKAALKNFNFFSQGLVNFNKSKNLPIYAALFHSPVFVPKYNFGIYGHIFSVLVFSALPRPRFRQISLFITRIEPFLRNVYNRSRTVHRIEDAAISKQNF